MVSGGSDPCLIKDPHPRTLSSSPAGLNESSPVGRQQSKLFILPLYHEKHEPGLIWLLNITTLFPSMDLDRNGSMVLRSCPEGLFIVLPGMFFAKKQDPESSQKTPSPPACESFVYCKLTKIPSELNCLMTRKYMPQREPAPDRGADP